MTNRIILLLSLGLLSHARFADGATGPAAATGACSHVIGPIGSDGNPIGFTCEDVGGSALLVWNASAISSSIDVSGGIRTVNFLPSAFTIGGAFRSDGSVAFIGANRITITGVISAPSIIVASMNVTEGDVRSSLLSSTPLRLVGGTGSTVYIDKGGAGRCLKR